MSAFSSSRARVVEVLGFSQSKAKSITRPSVRCNFSSERFLINHRLLSALMPSVRVLKEGEKKFGILDGGIFTAKKNAESTHFW